MFKSLDCSLLKVFRAVLEDCMSTFPVDRTELERDFSRLSLLVETRGLSVLTLDLPALGKHFDRCLASGAYAQPSLPLSGKRWNGKPIPKLFSGLVLRVFDQNGLLRINPDVNAIASLRQLYNLAKKLRIECKESKVYDAIQTFICVDAGLEAPSTDWRNAYKVAREAVSCSFTDRRLSNTVRVPNDTGSRHEPALHSTLQQVADIVATSLGSFDPGEWRPKHGPGAVSDLTAKENKYDFPNWSERLDSVFPYSEFAFANYGLWADSGPEEGCELDDEPSSRLISVPKTQKGPRLIAAEPTAHQWCQQIIWDFLESRVRSIYISKSITFRDQTGNQRLAQVSSMSGSHWTVDLSMASDYLSLWCVERAFRQNPSLLAALAASRTRFLTQELDKKSPAMIELKKFSTMGSACTFPVQSIFFYMCSVAAVCASRKLRPSRRVIRDISTEIRVFGDDIIIPSDAGEVLAKILDDLGFKLNPDKTFKTGKFRESCGVEAYEGYDVTPAYVTQVASTERPESVLSSLEQSNNFFLKGWWKTSEAIRQTVAIGPWPIVHVSRGAVGWKSFVGSRCTSKTRYNRNLQRYEYKTVKLSQRSSVRPINDWTALLQYFTEAPEPDLVWVSGVRRRPALKMRTGWEDVAVLGAECVEQVASLSRK